MRSTSGTWAPVLALAPGVLALHLALLAAWWAPADLPPRLGTHGLGRPSVQLLPFGVPGPGRSAAPDAVLPLAADAGPKPADGPGAQAAAPAPATATATATAPTAAGAAAPPPAGGRRLPSVPGPGPARSPAALPAGRDIAQAAPALPPSRLAVQTGAGQDLPAPAGPGGEPADTAAEDDASEAQAVAAQASAGEPPPLYPARLPAAATLRYALHHFGREGEAWLAWRPDGAAYRLQLLGLASAAGPAQGAASAPAAPPQRPASSPGRPLIEQTSQGRIDATGLQPERFTDRRRGRALRAANFRRERGQIEFSGGASPQPAWPGAQDRLSAWLQLPAIVAAAATVPAEIRLFVVGTRGQGELWRFRPVAAAADPADASPPTWQHWRHEPESPEGQRVELWLDPAQGPWPMRLRLTLLRSGGRLELRLRAVEPVT